MNKLLKFIDFLGLLSRNRLNLNVNAAAKRNKMSEHKMLHTFRSHQIYVDNALAKTAINAKGKTFKKYY